jgi:isochorismate synthase
MLIHTPNGRLEAGNLNATIKAALANNFGLALYKLPDDDKAHLVFGPAEHHPLADLPQQGGFLIAPFNFQEQVVFIEPSEVFTLESDIPEDDLKWHYRPSNDEGFSKEGFKKLARYGIEQIKAGSFDKVVAANKKVTSLPEGFQPLSYCLRLMEAYPGAFVSLTSTPQYGTWVGASPELLMNFDGSVIRTAAVAGTRSVNQEEPFGEKEEQEQALVSNYIEQTFENLALDYHKSEPKTVKAGNLIHIKTYYTSELIQQNPDLWKAFLKRLHPTPAVCGYPYQVSKIFIRNEEPFDRELYAGFLGPYHPEGLSSLFVNLRCMALHGEEAGIFAGAGIVKGSKSEEEWTETIEKMKTLEAIF